MVKKRLKILKFKNQDEGVVGIVVAILLIGLIITAMAFVQNVYVPKWMGQKESEHMGEVANQFSQLKFSIDTLSALGQPNTQISTPITLGSDEIPFLSTAKSYGSLNVMPNTYKIKIVDKFNEITSYRVGTIQYTSSNSYFIQQSYIFENGALILKQSKNDLMISTPLFSVTDTDDLDFQIIQLIGFGDRTSASGYGTYPIQARYSNSEKYTIYNVKNITIYTNYKISWQNYINDLLSESNLNYLIEETNYGNGIIIRFFNTENSGFPDLNLNIKEIKIQISTGWIE